MKDVYRIIFMHLLLLAPSIALAQTPTDDAIKGALAVLMITAVIGIIGLIFKGVSAAGKKAKPHVKSIATKGAKAARNMTKSRESRLLEIDDSFYKTAAGEIANNQQDEGLWIKAFTLSDGDEKKQKAIYIRLRATQLNERQREFREQVVPSGPTPSKREIREAVERAKRSSNWLGRR